MLEPKVVFFWKRRFQNIEYLNQHFSLTLDSYSGRALGFSRVFLCPPPIPQSEQISALQASKIAVDFLRSRKLEFQPNSNLLKRVVNDGVWGDGLKHHTTVKPGVVAWTMRFTLSERKYAEVYVDVHSGHIVGSDIVGSR